MKNKLLTYILPEPSELPKKFKFNKKLIIILILLIIVIYYKKIINFDYIKDKLLEYFNKLSNNKKDNIKDNIKDNKKDNIDNILIDDNSEINLDNDEEDLNISEETLNLIDNYQLKILNDKDVYLNLVLDNKPIGQIIIKLFNNKVPKTCNNFIELIKNKAYNNNIVHRLVKDFCIQAGDITNNDGSGGISIYGSTFADENFDIKHDQVGIVSMANKGQNTNNSQFFITLKETSWLDNKHVAFGKVIKGLDLIIKLNNLNVDNNSQPIQELKILEGGLI